MKQKSFILFSPVIRWGLPALLAFGVLLSAIRTIGPLRERKRLQSRLAEVFAQGHLLETLQPHHEALLTADRLEDWPSLQVPALKPLDREAVLQVSEQLRALAQTHGFAPGSIQLNVVTTELERRLQVKLPMQGRYQNLGAFLKETIPLPALVAIRRVHSVREQERDHMQVELELAVE